MKKFTNHNVLKETKNNDKIIIIGVIILVFGIALGLWGGYEIDKTSENAKSFSELLLGDEEKENQIAKLDVMYVPYQFAVQDGNNNSYYIVMDEDYMYVAYMPTSTFNSLNREDISENPGKIEGMTKLATREIKELAVEAYNDAIEDENYKITVADYDNYFGSVCKPIAKVLKLYDIYGMDTINGVICGNTILCHCYSPFFSYSENNGEYIKVMSEIGGRYINLFHATTDFQVNNELQFGVQDYGGFIKSPVGNVYSDKFVLMSILCQINFLLYGIEKWINNEIPTKLRFGYLLYYSLISVIEQINQKLGIALKINSKWKSDRFRNSMAHYKLGIVLKESNLIISDAMFGLTEKIFGEDYYTIKKSIYKELEKLAKQIGAYLDLPQRMVYLQ